VMGVRGTDFTVTAPETGDILVTCDEGDVSARTTRAGSFMPAGDRRGEAAPRALPGNGRRGRRPGSIPRNMGGPASTIPAAECVPPDPGQRTPLRQLVRDLNAANAQLLRSQSILSKWAEEDRHGRVGTRGEIFRERLAIGGQLGRLRQTQFRLERVSSACFACRRSTMPARASVRSTPASARRSSSPRCRTSDGASRRSSPSPAMSRAVRKAERRRPALRKKGT